MLPVSLPNPWSDLDNQLNTALTTSFQSQQNAQSDVVYFTLIRVGPHDGVISSLNTDWGLVFKRISLTVKEVALEGQP